LGAQVDANETDIPAGMRQVLPSAFDVEKQLIGELGFAFELYAQLLHELQGRELCVGN
jgi:hypothetical protein